MGCRLGNGWRLGGLSQVNCGNMNGTRSSLYVLVRMVKSVETLIKHKSQFVWSKSGLCKRKSYDYVENVRTAG